MCGSGRLLPTVRSAHVSQTSHPAGCPRCETGAASAGSQVPAHCMSAREIERKFLVKTVPPDLHQFQHRPIAQGYIVHECKHGTVRVRKKGPRHFLTVKRGDARNREELELPITREQFEQLWVFTKGRRLSKIRYDIPFGKRLVELDVFCGRHDGLILAEVEFPSLRAARAFKPPEWFGREVTGVAKFQNSRLATDRLKKD